MTYKETRHELENDRDRLHNIYIAQTRTIHELQDEVARLQQIDKETTERVAAEFDAKDFEDNAPEHEPDYIDFVNKEIMDMTLIQILGTIFCCLCFICMGWTIGEYIYLTIKDKKI